MDNDKQQEVENYYNNQEITDSFVEHEEVLGWHFGLWDIATKTLTEALNNSDNILTNKCTLKPGVKILDSGCGIGGLGIHLAQTYGVNVVGITISKSHVELARKIARDKGLEDLVQFYHMDFMDLDFEDNTFDIIFNRESFCYATNKLNYLQNVHRILKPHGIWQALEAFLSGKPLTQSQEMLHLLAQRGWKIPPLPTCDEIAQILNDLHFHQIETKDYSTMVAPTCRYYINKYLSIIATNTQDEIIKRDNVDAVLSGSINLIEGAISYNLIRGIKL